MIYKLLNTVCLITLFMLLLFSGCSKEWPADPPDVLRPVILSASPSEGSFLVPVNSPVQLSLSEPMDLNTINSNTFIISGEGDTIPGTWSESGTTYKFTPQNPFENLMQYSAVIRGAFNDDGKWLGPAARDKNGNSLEHDYSISFATVSDIRNTTLYFGRSDASEYDQSGAQKGIGYINLGDDASDGSLLIKTIGDFEPGELRLAFNPSRDKIYVTHTTGNKLWILNPASNQLEQSIDTGPIGPSFAAFTPNGQEVWVLGKETGKIAVISTSGLQLEQTIDLGVSPLNSMVINNAGTRGYITTGGSNTGSVIVLDISNRSVITTIEDIITGGQDYAFAGDIFISSDDSKVYFFNNYASPQIRIINTSLNSIEDDITLPLGGSDDEWVPVKDGNLLYIMGRWGTGGFELDLSDKSIKAQHSTDEAGCYLGTAVDPTKNVVFTVGNPTWDSPSNGIFSILRNSDLKKILTLKTLNESEQDLPWRYMLAK